jgi:hypothetical protein
VLRRSRMNAFCDARNALIEYGPMTLVTAWIRQLKDRDELVVASDSRLSGYGRWDCCPKLFPLQRNDSLLAFSGDTAFAYPILLQFEKSIPNYRKALSREQDITHLRPHLLNIIESMRNDIRELPRGTDSQQFRVLFAGFSHITNSFKAWSFYYTARMSKFRYRSLSFHRKRTQRTKPFLFMGDDTGRAYAALYRLLSERHKLTTGSLDMEPLEVLIDLINDEEAESIGGPPQVVKVYRHAQVLPINVLWPMEEPSYVAYFGRPLLRHELSEFPCYDLKEMEILAPYAARTRVVS